MSSAKGAGAMQGQFIFHGKGRLAVPGFTPYYSTALGDAYLADSLSPQGIA
jgi:hypothetical protein